ncbi:DUF4404 family protein [Lignipirellula cremea]|uniref:DUF4404 domain-containing protein n=1 Tax=Lignipirellula cremea TaxID=2528010 RepID=A0A518DZL2_9BACT|nr:DUF4404 family protein [Lignipirellula cremea]QDU97269.1 hypothetical protein Pla8534_51150 [Lignipirellula cremea]
MPERLDRLREALRDLELELSQLDLRDEEARQLLTDAKTEIETSLAAAKQPADIESHTFSDRLTDAEVQFAVTHPNLAAVVRRLIDVLGQMGI